MSARRTAAPSPRIAVGGRLLRHVQYHLAWLFTRVPSVVQASTNGDGPAARGVARLAGTGSPDECENDASTVEAADERALLGAVSLAMIRHPSKPFAHRLSLPPMRPSLA